MEVEKSCEKSPSEGCTNHEKVFACRVGVLAPIICLLAVSLVMLICMEVMPSQKDSHSDRNINMCGLLKCTVRYKNSSLVATCIESEQRNLTRKTDCLQFTVECISGSSFVNTRNRAPISGSNNANSSKNVFCLQNSTEFGFSQDHLAERGSTFLRRFIATNDTFQRCQLNQTKLEAYDVKLKTTQCRNPVDEPEGEMEKRMKKNTGIFDTVLVVLLCLALSAFFLMFVYTRRTLQVCCNKCYEEEL